MFGVPGSQCLCTYIPERGAGRGDESILHGRQGKHGTGCLRAGPLFSFSLLLPLTHILRGIVLLKRDIPCALGQAWMT